MSDRPSRYFIEYQDPAKWTPELQESYIEDTLTDEDAGETIESARYMVEWRRRRTDGIGHVGIYERLGFEQVEAPYGPWHFDIEHREDA